MAWLEVQADAAQIAPEQWQALAEQVQASWAQEELANGTKRWLAWLTATPDAWERALLAAAAVGIAPGALRHRCLQEEDWQTLWQRHWHARPIGKRLWLRPSFRHTPPPSGRIEIELLPGMAFGTGEHATTRLCLIALEAVLARHPARSVLDFGTGSGVLAIAAAKLGAVQVVAVDCAPEAVQAARANAIRNCVRIAVACGTQPPRRCFDGVLANILAEPLVALAPLLARASHRWLILSGILREQAARVQRAYETHGLRLHATHREGDWAALVFLRA